MPGGKKRKNNTSSEGNRHQWVTNVQTSTYFDISGKIIQMDNLSPTFQDPRRQQNHHVHRHCHHIIPIPYAPCMAYLPTFG